MFFVIKMNNLLSGGSEISTTKIGDVITVSWGNVFTYHGRLEIYSPLSPIARITKNIFRSD
jgi:hypothetical protein